MTEVKSIFEKLDNYLVEKPKPLIGAETVQIFLIREVLDYLVLRTEEDRQLNTVVAPLSISNSIPTRRVAFLATKQKASESRELEHLLRSALKDNTLYHLKGKSLVSKIEKSDNPLECYLKDNLCMECPRCGLYGATSTVSGQAERANIKHRIEYSTAFSLMPFEDVSSAITFNAIDDKSIMTGQALGSRYAVAPATLFPSIITLKSITREELILTIKTILSCKSYGAESRIGGDVRNHVIGVVAAWEEVITSLEFALELYDKLNALNMATVNELIIGKDGNSGKYKNMAGNPDKIIVFNENEVNSLVKECVDTKLDQNFMEKAYKDIEDYRKIQLS
ncbi:MAG: type I-D CRISPR-associated protein Cas7/Csc2 [Candidatus Fischerbacteria bacterium RBG_13_37_8]|uniref:Type I-D CRISPR-associated protein Cas7/Csc2 n=1 Tax=Candidatus Fischerbacteria bacterium RBG_13_37_8 TaxID=1817863 RepID=A0A1F5VY77_9BACT|nr:MAG: type I-D CRISPR-associated protein Cas7/Csc2 [Candidatus Fischerbacteria bacterium RBG_13_37_8]